MGAEEGTGVGVRGIGVTDWITFVLIRMGVLVEMVMMPGSGVASSPINAGESVTTASVLTATEADGYSGYRLLSLLSMVGVEA